MRLASLSTAAVLVALSSTADAQFSAALNSSQFSPRGGGQQNAGDYGYSDCVSENALGLTNGGQIAWFQGFDSGAAGDTITSVNAANGTTTGSGSPAGSAGGAYVYDDPGGDFTDPTDLGAPVDSGSWITASPNTDIKEPTAVTAPVTDGFWLAAHMTQIAGEFPAAFDTNNLSGSTTWVSGSNTVFDPTNPGGGIGFFEMAALGFDSVWLLSGCSSGTGIATYCTAKSGLVCGLPAIGFSGVPDPSQSSGFDINAAPARGNRSGLLLYTCSGRAALPFQGGLLCVNPAPLRRVPPVSSGGTNGACDGVFSVDWNTFASGNGGGNPDPCTANSGQQVNAQWWGRDSVATGSFLSDGIEFTNP